MTTVGSCTGACCAAFYLPTSHTDATPARWSHVKDGERLSFMLLPIGSDEAAERLAGSGSAFRFDPENPNVEGHLYTCRFWDEGTRRCVQYETRPWTCSAYPYGTACRYCGETAGEVIP